MDNQIQTFFLLTFCPDKEYGIQSKEVVEKNLKKIFYELDRNKGLIYFEKKTKVFPVHLLDEMNLSCQNFGLKTVFEKAYEQFKNYIIDGKELKEIESYLSKNEDNLIINNENDNKINFNDKKRIFDILNNNENIMYKYIKDIDDLIVPAKIESISSINYYSVGCSLLGILGFVTVPFLMSLKKSLFLKLAENFKKVINDKEKEELTEINSNKIYEYNLEKNIPLFSAYANYKDVQNFGNYYVNKYEKELSEEGIDGLAKYLVGLINCYNNAIEGLKEIGKYFNE